MQHQKNLLNINELRMKRLLLINFILCFGALLLAAQKPVSGVVTDADTSEPLIGATILLGTEGTGVTTDVDGRFVINLKVGDELKVSYIGYETQKVKYAGQSEIKITLKASVTTLNDLVVTSQVAVTRQTPIAASTVDPLVIESKISNQEFPEILKATPGVYVTKNGGGYGDSKINMRGFQSANVAVMVNGVPVNDMEWGGVYWSNWTGLSDVTRYMQTQRGLGASKVSSPSVGGSINIITKSTEAKQGGSVSYSLGNDGYNKLAFNVSSGLFADGWAFTVAGSRAWGDGYIQGTEFVGWTWFANVSKVFDDHHSLSLTAFGAPQWHNQRSNYDGLTLQGWQNVANYMDGESRYKYNPTYGFGKNGERKTSARNEYHKPQISLNYNWSIDDISSWSTVLYTSIGRGSGYNGQNTSAYSGAWYGTSNGVLNDAFRNEDGTFAYDRIQEMNENSESGSQMVMSRSKNYHNWYGLISTYTRQLPHNIDFYGGIDVRYYKGIHTNEIIDLYNGDYYIDRYRNNVDAANNAAALDPNFASQKLKVGDVVYRDYDGHVMQEGLFAQAEGTFGPANVFVSASASNTAYWRYDRFYYDAAHARSKTVNFWGYTVKGGANFNLNNTNNVFANLGYISRAPFFSGGAFLQSTTSNEINPDAVNEKIFSAELGYGYHYQNYINVNVNLYYTLWMDKTMTKSSDFSYTDGDGNIVDDRAIINMQGVDAQHMGVEIDVKSSPVEWLELTGMFSIGDWRWNSNATGYFYNSAGQPLADNKGTIASGIQAEDHASMTLNLKGVHVGGSAQTTAALGVTFKPVKGLRVGADFNYFCRNYADWSFSSSDLVMGGEKSYTDSWQIPGAGLLDLNASYSFKLSKTVGATVSANVQNVLDQLYIADAYDGGDGSWQSAYRVFYGFGRTWSCRLKITF